MSGRFRSSPSLPRGAQTRAVPTLLLMSLYMLLLWSSGCASSARFVPEKGKSYSLGMFHTVSRGDSIHSIGSYYQRDPALLAWFNELKSPYLLRPGTLLYVPPSNDSRILTSGRLRIELVRETRRRLAGNPSPQKPSLDKYPVGEKVRLSYKLPNTTKVYVEQSASTPPKQQVYRDKVANPEQKILLASVPAKTSRSKPKVKAASVRPSAPKKATVKKSPTPYNPPSGSRETFMWPLDRFTFIRGFTSSILTKDHKGVDLAAPEGSTVHASRSGKVLFSGVLGAFGNMVVLDHGDGFSSLYAHAQRTLVKKGQSVRKGQPIALVGATGRATGPHVHMEVRMTGTGEALDPEDYLPVLKTKDREVVMNR